MVFASRQNGIFSHFQRKNHSRPSLDQSLPSGPSPAKSTTTSTTTYLSPTGHVPRSASDSQSSLARTSSSTDDDGLATILIGQRQQKFTVNKRLLCAASPFFREYFDSPTSSSSSLSTSSNSTSSTGRRRGRVSLWLPGESASMFAFFVEWLHAPRSFRKLLEHTLTASYERGYDNLVEVQWVLVRLHLFASHLGLCHLQDLAMDAIQDLYLKCNWDVGPELITYLYTKCEPVYAVRIRRWAVAMVAFSLTGASVNAAAPPMSPISETSSDDDNNAFIPSRIHHLLDTLPEFTADHAMHMDKMTDSGLDVRFKNPQLRIPANKLRNEERAFGFRQCSFHTHRASVGERRCLYERRSARHANKDAGRKEDGSDASTPLFSVDEKDEDREKSLKHMRSIPNSMK